ncbi:MAG TPA: hypothetical protein VED63_06840 [Acidimicrobiales bacterium]|nr:hypothetical protein [Acidimicrobiales bacterium]
MTMLEPAEGVRLCLPEEPEELRLGLRDAVLGGGDWREGFSDDICIGVWIWEQWRPTLEPAGMDRETFVEVVTAYRRELWFWLMGDRRWGQLIEGLAGRVGRRLPAS